MREVGVGVVILPLVLLLMEEVLVMVQLEQRIQVGEEGVVGEVVLAAQAVQV